CARGEYSNSIDYW
nr:immunoglobulin heavy chain junction region [Macaca mulatta]MOX58579.1 immunoglobulin heavy chain junction region [Macaca mulatta]MOX58602.1 immunoglobulin heavy chain junction region [Macaca mulatta]MOX58773.1 immunoglobulin heavy chain junction region [Macaca mulatta]MOX58774.1 immunoglobulin heavy chain junction region [Macaca mulatta]